MNRVVSQSDGTIIRAERIARERTHAPSDDGSLMKRGSQPNGGLRPRRGIVQKQVGFGMKARIGRSDIAAGVHCTGVAVEQQGRQIAAGRLDGYMCRAIAIGATGMTLRPAARTIRGYGQMLVRHLRGHHFGAWVSRNDGITATGMSRCRAYDPSGKHDCRAETRPKRNGNSNKSHEPPGAKKDTLHNPT
jgi:hypothetical protein